MKITFLNQYCGFFGGVEQSVATAAEALSAHGHHCTLLYEKHTESRLQEYQELFDETIHVPTEQRLISAIASLVEQNAIDVLFVHKLSSSAPLSPFKGSLRMVRMIHDHDECCPRKHKYFFFSNRICHHRADLRCWLDLAFIERDRQSRFGLRFNNIATHRKELVCTRTLYDRYLVGSRFMQEELRQNGFPAEKIRCIPPCVKPTEQAACPVPDSNEILYVGQLIKGKGVDLLLEAVSHLTTPFKLTIAGTGNARDQLIEQAKNLGIEAVVKFAGWVPPDELNQLYMKSRILAVPSRWAEPFGMIGLEAMRNGRPVVAFDVGGIPDWLEDGVNGYLVPEKNVRQLASAIDQLLTDHNKAQEFGSNGRRKFETIFSFDNYVRQLSAVLGR